jgi:hypothetical protein
MGETSPNPVTLPVAAQQQQQKTIHLFIPLRWREITAIRFFPRRKNGKL